MGLSVMCSLALMLLLFSSILHLVSLVLPAWVQLNVLVPVPIAQEGEGGGGTGGGEESETVRNATGQPLESFVDYRGPRIFVGIRLGLWEWCDQFRQVSPNCEEPGFVSGAEVMAMVSLFTLPLSFFLLCYSACLERHCLKRRSLTRHACITSAISGLLLVMILTMYGILARKEIRAMLLQIGEQGGLPTYLGWAFGAEGVACVLACVAALCLLLHLRHSPKAATEVELEV